MRKSVYILLAILLLSGCGKESELPSGAGGTQILLHPGMFATRVIDEDNPESEQQILNLTVLLTEPSSDVITHRYVRTGFASFDDYKLVTLPDDPAVLGFRDIYVMTNYGSANFNSIKNLGELAGLKTPAVTKNSPLYPDMGFCMYGETMNHDFNNAEKKPALVYVKRTCSKYKITLTFPGNPSLSVRNSFLIRHTASYTQIVEDSGIAVPSTAYFDFARNTDLTADGNGAYVNTVYLYEAPEKPQIYLYTNMGNSQQTFIAELPTPARNYFYDILMEVYQENTRSAAGDKRYVCSTKIDIYDSNGTLIDIIR